MRRFLDTNVLVRYLTGDDPAKGNAALNLLLRAEDGTEALVTSPMVIFETIFTLGKSYGASKKIIRRGIEDILTIRGVQLANKGIYLEALHLFETTSLSFADAYNAALMRNRGITEIYTWDEDFDKVNGLNRLEPS
jgi:uncharacterized protein